MRKKLMLLNKICIYGEHNLKSIAYKSEIPQKTFPLKAMNEIIIIRQSNGGRCKDMPVGK